jgi:hypothetical protein
VNLAIAGAVGVLPPDEVEETLVDVPAGDDAVAPPVSP